MNTASKIRENRLTRLARIGLWLALAIGLSACDKKCQQPVDQPFQSFVEQEWRLVESSDPAFADRLTNFTFPIFLFHRDFSGEVSPVLFNNPPEDEETPALSFVYDVPEQDVMRIQYNTAEGPTDVRTYNYDLGRELELTDVENGSYFRFVPFQGIVDPDKDCTF